MPMLLCYGRAEGHAMTALLFSEARQIGRAEEQGMGSREKKTR
jgi:hypothetical protein